MDTQTNGIYLTLIASLVFLTVLLVLFIVSMLRHLRLRLKAVRQQLTREIELIDTERNRISADLHDELGSGLSAIGLLMRQAAEISGSPQLQKAQAHLETQQQKIKEISHDLVPRVLETHGLPVALNDLYEEIRSAGTLQLKVLGGLPVLDWQPAKTVHLYRVMRELLTNALKHARATQIIINIEPNKNNLQVTVSDNGIGFDLSHQKQNRAGLGLQNLDSRIGLLDATLAISSAKGKGTACRITVPLRSIVRNYGK
jgi:two-component system NarL family sensor kinase